MILIRWFSVRKSHVLMVHLLTFITCPFWVFLLYTLNEKTISEFPVHCLTALQKFVAVVVCPFLLLCESIIRTWTCVAFSVVLVSWHVRCTCISSLVVLDFV